METKICIKVLLERPAPKKISPHYKQESFEEKIEKCITRVKSNLIDSETEWKYLKRVYEILSKRPNLTDEQLEIVDKLEELMQKYGNLDHEDSVQLDGQYMNRGKGPE